jgi:hypothetical protein
MTTSNEDFFTQDRMRAIGLGIGKGFQSYDPNNPFAGAGAAMETTIGSEMGIEARKESRTDQETERADRVKAQDKAEANKRDTEDRAEERAIRDDERARGNLKKDQEEQAKRWKEMNVGVVSQGKDSQSAVADRRKNSLWMQDFANAMSGGYPRLKGNSPVEIYEELLAEIKANPKDNRKLPYSQRSGQ